MKCRGRKGERQRGSLEGWGRNQLFELCQCQNLWGVYLLNAHNRPSHRNREALIPSGWNLALNLPGEGGNGVAAVTQSFSLWSPGSHSSMILVSIGIKLCRAKAWIIQAVPTGWIPLAFCKLVRVLTCLCATSFQTFRFTERANSPSFFPLQYLFSMCALLVFQRPPLFILEIQRKCYCQEINFLFISLWFYLAFIPRAGNNGPRHCDFSG